MTWQRSIKYRRPVEEHTDGDRAQRHAVTLGRMQVVTRDWQTPGGRVTYWYTVPDEMQRRDAERQIERLMAARGHGYLGPNLLVPDPTPTLFDEMELQS